MPIDEAKKAGAMALFGEKYGAEVRMVTVDGVPESGIEPSRELCGGTHVTNTGEIGAFLVVSESAIAAGVRRFEARCGAEAVEHVRAQLVAHVDREVSEIQKLQEQIAELSGVRDEKAWLRGEEYVYSVVLKAESAVAGTDHLGADAVVRGLRSTLASVESELGAKLESLRTQVAALKKSQSEAARGGLEAEMTKLAAGATDAPGGRWIVAEIASEADANAVRDAADRLRGTLKRGAAVLALAGGGKLTFVAAVTDDLVAAKTLNASDLVKKVAQVTGGSGGGKPHLALAGGKDASKLADALAEARKILGEALA
jgi:alanyl-tRNA synthetase